MEEMRESQQNLKTFNLAENEMTSEEESLLQSCKIFPFRYKNSNSKTVKPLAYSFVFIICIMCFILALMNRPEILPVLGVGAFALFLIFVIKERQIDMMKKLTQYFRDENGEFYRVVFTQGASVMAVHRRTATRGTISNVGKKAAIVDRNLEEAQEIYPAFYYVQRYKQGIKDWDAFNGGLARVTHLKDLTLVERGAKKSVYTCEIDGKKTSLKILNAYDGLCDATKNSI